MTSKEGIWFCKKCSDDCMLSEFSSLDTLEAHIREHHFQWVAFSCSYCPEDFYGLGATTSHHSEAHPEEKLKIVHNLNVSHTNSMQDYVGSTSVVSSNKNYRCKPCFEDNSMVDFASKSDLKSHIRAAHLSWTPFRCFWCSVSGSGREELIPHIKIAHPLLSLKIEEIVDETKNEQIEAMILTDSHAEDPVTNSIESDPENPSNLAEDESDYEEIVVKRSISEDENVQPTSPKKLKTEINFDLEYPKSPKSSVTSSETQSSPADPFLSETDSLEKFINPREENSNSTSKIPKNGNEAVLKPAEIEKDTLEEQPCASEINPTSEDSCPDEIISHLFENLDAKRKRKLAADILNNPGKYRFVSSTVSAPPRFKIVTPQPRTNLTGHSSQHSFKIGLAWPKPIFEGRPMDSPDFCFGCNRIILRDKRRHTWEAHFPVKEIICCPVCPFSSRYSITSVREHIQKQHPGVDPLSFTDRRTQFEDHLNEIFVRCFPVPKGDTMENHLKRYSQRLNDRTSGPSQASKNTHLFDPFQTGSQAPRESQPNRALNYSQPQQTNFQHKNSNQPAHSAEISKSSNFFAEVERNQQHQFWTQAKHLQILQKQFQRPSWPTTQARILPYRQQVPQAWPGNNLHPTNPVAHDPRLLYPSQHPRFAGHYPGNPGAMLRQVGENGVTTTSARIPAAATTCASTALQIYAANSMNAMARTMNSQMMNPPVPHQRPMQQPQVRSESEVSTVDRLLAASGVNDSNVARHSIANLVKQEIAEPSHATEFENARFAQISEVNRQSNQLSNGQYQISQGQKQLSTESRQGPAQQRSAPVFVKQEVPDAASVSDQCGVTHNTNSEQANGQQQLQQTNVTATSEYHRNQASSVRSAENLQPNGNSHSQLGTIFPHQETSQQVTTSHSSAPSFVKEEFQVTACSAGNRISSTSPSQKTTEYRQTGQGANGFRSNPAGKVQRASQPTNRVPSQVTGVREVVLNHIQSQKTAKIPVATVASYPISGAPNFLRDQPIAVNTAADPVIYGQVNSHPPSFISNSPGVGQSILDGSRISENPNQITGNINPGVLGRPSQQEMVPGNRIQQAQQPIPMDKSSIHYCYGCDSMVPRDKRKHVWERHFPIKEIICCPLCSVSSRYAITSVRQHIEKAHPHISPMAFIDRRVQYEKDLNLIFSQCFRDPRCIEYSYRTHNIKCGRPLNEKPQFPDAPEHGYKQLQAAFPDPFNQ